MKVVKFGGSSMADAGQYRKIREILEADPARKIVVVSAAGKAIIFNTLLVLSKAARDTQGVQVIKHKNVSVISAEPYIEGTLPNQDTYRTKTVPIAGALYDSDVNQIKFS